MQAAIRQLDCALKLWFEDGDLVSIHTLVGAAYHIANDIHKHRGGTDLLFNPDIVAAEYKEEFRKALRRDFMFFKHADRDADGETMFPPFITMLFIMVTMETLKELNDGGMTGLQMCFLCWMALFAPDLVKSEIKAGYDALPAEYRAFVLNLNKREFLENMLEGFAARANIKS